MLINIYIADSDDNKEISFRITKNVDFFNSLERFVEEKMIYNKKARSISE